MEALQREIGVLRTIVETAADAIVTVSVSGIVRSVNASATRLLGYAAQEMVGRNVTMLMTEADAAHHDEYLARFVEAKVVGRERLVRARAKDGSVLPVNLSLSEGSFGEERFVTAILRDARSLLAAQGELEREKKILEGVLLSSVDAILVIDLNGIVQRVNGATLRTFGFSEAELVGHNVSMLMPEPYRSQHDRYLQQYAATGLKKVIGIGRQVVGRRKDGSTLPLHLAVSEVKTEDGPFFAGFLTDLSELQRAKTALEKEKRTLEGILLSSVDPILVIDPRGFVQRINGSTVRMFGFSEAELIGQNVSILMPEPYRSQHDSYLQRYLATGLKRVIGIGREVVGMRKDGSTLPLHLAVSEVAIDGVSCFAGFLTDLSELKNAFQSSDKAKSLFLANMSHEIRTPMNGIMGMMALLKDSVLDKAGRSYVDVCMRSCDSLLAVLNDILLYSKADAGAIELDCTPFNLNTTVEDVLQFLSSSVPTDKEIEVTYSIGADVPLFLYGDASRFRQVLLNLLSNAIKFTSVGEVSLEVSLIALTPLTIEFAVHDTGIGISKEDQAKLFAPFSQADATITRKYGGTGLGLAICKHLVKLFEGELSVHSMVGRGSTFTFSARFKVDKTRPRRLLRDALGLGDEIAELRGVRVLVIDHNATNCTMLDSLLTAFGCRVQTARTGDKGLDALRGAVQRNEPIQLVLLDYHMPQTTGLDVARSIAQRKWNPKIVALARLGDCNLAREPNIAAVCSKPIRRGQLMESLIEVMRVPDLPEGTVPDEAGNQETTNAAAVSPSISQPRRSSTETMGEGALKGVCVMVVEDNETNRDVLTLMLQQAQCRVIQAVNGVDALVKFCDEVQVVLMDYFMPLLDGVSSALLLFKLRPSLPIIFLTADVTIETEIKCRKAGAFGVLRKPASKMLVLSTLAEALGRLKYSDAQPRILCLIVDDNKTNLMMAGHVIKKIFANQPIEVRYAEDGQAAVDSMAQDYPDLILMDVKMPRLNGIEATRAIRQMANAQNITIVGITGVDETAVVRECRAAGMDSILTKPLREQDLRPLVANVKRGGGGSESAHLVEIATELAPAETAANLLDDSFVRELDAAFRTQLLKDWHKRCGKQLRSVREAVSGGEWKTVLEMAHSLKGSSAQLGATLLSLEALRLERAAKQTPRDAMEARAAVERMWIAASRTAVHFGLDAF